MPVYRMETAVLQLLLLHAKKKTPKEAERKASGLCLKQAEEAQRPKEKPWFMLKDR